VGGSEGQIYYLSLSVPKNLVPKGESWGELNQEGKREKKKRMSRKKRRRIIAKGLRLGGVTVASITILRSQILKGASITDRKQPSGFKKSRYQSGMIVNIPVHRLLGTKSYLSEFD